MKGDLIEWLAEYDKYVENYHRIQWNDRAELNRLLKTLSIIMSQLEHFRIEANKKHNGIMFNFEGSAAQGKIKADFEVESLYQLRRIMNAGYRIMDSIRSNISSCKKEQ